MKSVSAEQPAKSGERIENGDKDTKKKKRRGSRRSKNTSGIIDFVYCSSNRSGLVPS